MWKSTRTYKRGRRKNDSPLRLSCGSLHFFPSSSPLSEWLPNSRIKKKKKKKEEMEGEAAAARGISKTEFDGLKLERRDHLPRDEAHALRCAAQFNKVRTIICVSPSFQACCNAEDSKGQSCASSAWISVTISSRHLLESTEDLLLLFFLLLFSCFVLCKQWTIFKIWGRQ